MKGRKGNMNWHEVASYIIGDFDFLITENEFKGFANELGINIPKNENSNSDTEFAEGGGIKSDCIEFIKNTESITNNGYYLHIKNLNVYVDSGDKTISKVKSLLLITYNSGGQSNLKASDTINSSVLSSELAKILGCDISVARIIVSEQISYSKRFSLDILNNFKNENIIIANRDKIVCTNIEKFEQGGVIEFNKKMSKEYLSTYKEEYGTIEKINEMIARNYLHEIAIKYFGGTTEIEFVNEKKNPKNHFQMRLYLGDFILYTAPFIYVDDKHKVVSKKTKIELLNNDYETIQSNIKFSEGGSITCKNCNWSWDKKDTQPHDAYVCHKCGYDNELKKGIKAESEHIKTAKDLYEHNIKPNQAAKSIAEEHLKEDPQYYTKLLEKFKKGGNLNAKQKTKFGKVIREFYAKKLYSNDNLVTDKNQALAIAYSEANSIK
jgi:transposase-like protein